MGDLPETSSTMRIETLTRPPPFPGSRLEWRHWRWWYAPIGAALSVVSAMVPTWWQLDQAVGQAVQAIVQIALVIAVAALLAGRISAGDVGLQWRGTARTLWVATATFLAMQLASWLFEHLSAQGAEASRQVMESFGFGKSVARDAGFIVIIAALGPLTEEVLFRGLVFRALRDGVAHWRRVPGALASGAAMLVSAWLFMGIHGGPGQEEQLGMLMLMGALFALSYEFGGTLYAPILAHSLNNTVALFQGLTGKDAPAQMPVWMLGLLAACPLLALGAAWLIGRLIPRWAAARHGDHGVR